MDLVLLPFLVLLAVGVRTGAIYGAARIMFADPPGWPMALAVGFFGGMFNVLFLFIPLGSLLGFLVDYALVKRLYRTDGVHAFAIMLVAGVIGSAVVAMFRLFAG